MSRSCLCCFSSEVALYWTNLQAQTLLIICHYQLPAQVYTVHNMKKEVNLLLTAPVLVEGIGDELGVERDIRKAVTVFYSADNTRPRRTHRNKILNKTFNYISNYNNNDDKEEEING